ncbi:hypothetical protein KC335_g12175, partial [Hortaea werneckii]
MPSASKLAREAKKAEAGKGKKASKKEESPLLDADGNPLPESDQPATKMTEKVKQLTVQEDKHGISDRVTTGVLASQESNRDVKI